MIENVLFKKEGRKGGGESKKKFLFLNKYYFVVLWVDKYINTDGDETITKKELNAKYSGPVTKLYFNFILLTFFFVFTLKYIDVYWNRGQYCSPHFSVFKIQKQFLTTTMLKKKGSFEPLNFKGNFLASSWSTFLKVLNAKRCALHIVCWF